MKKKIHNRATDNEVDAALSASKAVTDFFDLVLRSQYAEKKEYTEQLIHGIRSGVASVRAVLDFNSEGVAIFKFYVVREGDEYLVFDTSIADPSLQPALKIVH